MVTSAEPEVVLKAFPGDLDRRTRSAWERENARWSRVPGTRVVHGTDVIEGRFTVQAERCPLSLVDTAPLPIPEALALARALATTLAAAHAAGLVHGGITAHNVLFRATGEPVLADGGLVLRDAFPVAPPVEWAAPETVRDAVRDARADHYGLGAVLFFALTGKPPHPARLGEGPEEHALRVLGEPAPELERPDVPLGLAKLVHALLARDPDARPADVLAELDRITATAPPATAPPATEPQAATEPRTITDPTGVPRPTGKRIQVAEAKPLPDTDRRERIGLILGVAAALALFAAAPLLLLRDDPPAPSPQAPAVSAPRAPQIHVIEVQDAGDHVTITWSGPDLDYVVITAPEGKPNFPSPETRDRTARITVEPNRKHCFEVQGTDGRNTYHSKPHPIRSAKCTR
ncbi:protein kinase [Saccharothrix sp.]|uniref:protein kinase domain-containing protein n=1 Tax=Saccharothrix sp. TaxID=1873460 RepID=UPI0028110C1F|nr:protein kinase [Saccharothrix sp.]